MLIWESWKVGGEEKLIGQEEEKKLKQKGGEGAPVAPSSAPSWCASPMARLSFCTCSGWNQPKLHHSLMTLLSRSPSIALIRQVWLDFYHSCLERWVVLVILWFSCFLLFSIFNCCEICVKVARGLGGKVGHDVFLESTPTALILFP